MDFRFPMFPRDSHRRAVAWRARRWEVKGQASAGAWRARSRAEPARAEAVPPTFGEFAKINTHERTRAQSHERRRKTGPTCYAKRKVPLSLQLCVRVCVRVRSHATPSSPRRRFQTRSSRPKPGARRLMTARASEPPSNKSRRVDP